MNANTLNPAEMAISQIPPQFVRSVAPAVMNGAKQAAGLSDVPNDLLGGLVGATPLGALAGVLSQPDPTMISAVNANPDLKYGDRYMENLVGQSKTGSFIVQSGSDQNAENRQQQNPADGGAGKFIVWTVVIAGAVWLLSLIKR